MISAVSSMALLLLFLSVAHVERPLAPVALMNRLAGTWTLTGRLGDRKTTHDLSARWVLKHEYLEIHETSREKDASGSPLYAAIVFLSWNGKAHAYYCMWLDSTAGGGLTPQGIARGQQARNAIPLIFTVSKRESLHTTFAYGAAADSWRLTIDDVTGGRADRFGDVTLQRRK